MIHHRMKIQVTAGCGLLNHWSTTKKLSARGLIHVFQGSNENIDSPHRFQMVGEAVGKQKDPPDQIS